MIASEIMLPSHAPEVYLDRATLWNAVESCEKHPKAQAASFYGIRVGRNGMVCCPFHNDRTPSMKVDSRFYCFGCGASGDVIDFAALLHGLGKREAAVRLAKDFGVSYEKPGNAPPDRKRHNRSQPRQKSAEQRFQETERYCFRVLCDYLRLLEHWKTAYAPQPQDAIWHPLFAL